MSHDVGLQRAIFASLKTTQAPRPAPAPRLAPTQSFNRNYNPTITRGNYGSNHNSGSSSRGVAGALGSGSGNKRFSSSRSDAIPSGGQNRSFSSYNKSSASNSMGTLERQGFIAGNVGREASPTQRNRGILSSRQGPSSTVSSPSSSRPPSPRKASTGVVPRLTKSKSASSMNVTPRVSDNEDFTTDVAGWSRCSGRGILKHGEQDKDNRVIHSDHPSFYITTCDASSRDPDVRDGNYKLVLSAKILRRTPTDPQMFFIVLGAKASPGAPTPNFIAVSMDVARQVWKVERYQQGKHTVLGEAHDPLLKPSTTFEVEVQVQGKCVSVSRDGEGIFENVKCEGGNLVGPVGIGVYKSKAIYRDFAIGGCDGPCDVVAPPRTLEPYTGDDPELVDMINRDMICKDLGTTFDDIASLDNAKRLMNEAVVLPLIIPEFFTGIRHPWKGVLLFGPPGTGKTMLAKAVASMTDTTFFNCTSSTLVSKWRGESEKLVKTLFKMAKHHAPSIIFFDEIDSLMSARGNASEHEASRRFKSEVITQMDGILSDQDDGLVMVLATSNCPWDLDEAMRRRLEKRIYIPVPDVDARREMFRLNLRKVNLSGDINFDALAQNTENYSGADIHLVCREASMMGMRKLISQKSPQEIKRLKGSGALEYSTSMADFTQALSTTQSSICNADVKKFQLWNKEFGAS